MKSTTTEHNGDILGLDNLGVINETCKLAGIDILTPDNTDLNDEKVWRSITEDTTLIFQWESDSAQAYLKKFMSPETIAIAKQYNPDFSYIKWLSFGNGLIRPGCASFRDEVAEGKATPTGFPALDDFLSVTLYRITMQEDIMRFCKLFCGYSDAESDNVRRAIAKKKGTENLLGELHDRFLSYSHDTYGEDIDKLEKIFPPIRQGILDASSYAFSWNHSDAYSCIGYISGYLRYYYPLEFLTASLNIFCDKEEKTVAITNYADKMGIKILAPKFRHSSAEYMMDKENNTIYKGIASIKYLNRSVAEQMYALRNSPIESFCALLSVFPGDARQLDVLIRLGFFSEFGKTKKLLKIAELFDKYNIKKDGSTKQINKDENPLMANVYEQFCSKITPKKYVFDASGIRKMLQYMESIIPDEDIPLQTRLKAEVEYLGYAQTRIPDAEDTAAIMSIDCKYSPKLQLYNLMTGEMFIAKISKRAFQYTPIAEGDIIKYETVQKPRMYKDENGMWQEDYGRMETWLSFYGITTKYQR